MPTLRRYSYATFAVACTHLVFGAIVRISGSGMGCGDNWPRCYGSFFPPLSRPDLIIEVTHRYLASILLLSLIGLAIAAYRRRAEAGVGGRGGVLRSASLAVALGFSAALLGAMTVKLGNAPFATLAHWTVAMSLVAAVVATVIRAGGLGGAAVRLHQVSRATRSATAAGAGLALVAVVMGGLTAKYPGASVACQAFPLCGPNPDVQRAAVHVQLTHRIIAVLLVLHLFGVVMAQRKRRESAVILRTAKISFSLGILQLLVAGAMIGMHLPPVLRSLHEATGVSIWIATFALAYLARRAGEGDGVPALVDEPAPMQPSSAAAFAGAASVRPPVTFPALRAAGSDDATPSPEPTTPEQQARKKADLAVLEEALAALIVDDDVAAALAEANADLTTPSDLATVEQAIAELGLPPDVATPSPDPDRLARSRSSSTMSHSVAVIVARGADC
ncbi:MAG: COX15/CtaA family protein [bacterium]